MKAKKQPKSATTVPPGTIATADTSALTAELEQLKLKVSRLEKESEQIKKQFNQLVSFIKQKLT